MNEIIIFIVGLSLGAHLIDWFKSREIKKLEKEIEDLRIECSKMDRELDELKHV